MSAYTLLFFDYIVYKINRFTNLRQRIMKKLVLSAIMAICAMSAAEAQNMKVIVTGIKNNTGKVLIQIQNDKQENVGQQMRDAKKDSCTFMFQNVGLGNLKISLFHDENMNYNIDKDEQGIPTEGFIIKSVKINGKSEDTVVENLKMYYPSK
jgi:uncharacterized protein (DUF2141 family)